MMRRAGMAVVMLLLAATATAQDPLAAATEAYRQGDFPKAARLFEEAAAAEKTPAERAEIRVKLAWTYYALKSRVKAEEALVAALTDDPGHELVRDYYTDDFLALLEKARKRVAAGSPPSRPTLPPERPAPPQATTTLTQLRQRLANASEPTTLEMLLVDMTTVEMTSQPQQLPEVLELKAEALDRLGRTGEALKLRGRLAALRATSQALPGASAVPLDVLLEARRYLASGRADDAVSLLQGVLAAQPSCVPALEVLGEALAEAGRLDEASEAVRTAMYNGEKPDLLLLQGEIELRRNRLAQARDAFRRLVETDLGNDRGWAALGLLLARTGDLPSARDALDKALRANGMLAEPRVVRAQICLLDAQAPAAIGHLQRATQLKPEDPWAQGWLGVAYLASGNATAAKEKLEAAVNAGQGQFTLALAEALRRLGDLNRALQALDKLPPGDAKVRIARARCLLDADRPDDAAALMRELVTEDPNQGEASYLLACALHARREWDEAVAVLDQTLRLPGFPAVAPAARASTEATRRAQELLDNAEVPPPPPPKK